MRLNLKLNINLKFDITYNLKYSESHVTLHILHRLPSGRFFSFASSFKHYFSLVYCKAYCTIAEFYECFFTYNNNVYLVNNVYESCELRNQQYHSLKPPYFEFLVNLNFGSRLLAGAPGDDRRNVAGTGRIQSSFGCFQIVVPSTAADCNIHLDNLTRRFCGIDVTLSRISSFFKCNLSS